MKAVLCAILCCVCAMGCSTDSVGQPVHADGDAAEITDGDVAAEEVEQEEPERVDGDEPDAEPVDGDSPEQDEQAEAEEEAVDYPAHGIEPVETVEVDHVACAPDSEPPVSPQGQLVFQPELRADPGPAGLRRGTAGLSGVPLGAMVSDDQGNLMVVSEDLYASYSGDMGESWSGDCPLPKRDASVIKVLKAHNRYALRIRDNYGEGLLWKQYPFTEESGWEFVRLPDDLPEGTSVNFAGFRLFNSERLFYFYKVEGDSEVSYYSQFSDDGGSSFSQPVLLLVDTHNRKLISFSALGSDGFLWILADENDIWLLYEFDNSGQLQQEGQSLIRPQYPSYVTANIQGIPVLIFYAPEPYEGVFARYDAATHGFGPFMDMALRCQPGLFGQSAFLENGDFAMFASAPDPAVPGTNKLRYVVRDSAGQWRGEDVLNFNAGFWDECNTSKSTINAFAYPDGRAVAMVSNTPAMKDDSPYERILSVPMEVYSRNPDTGQWASPVETRVHSDEYWPIPVYPRWVQGMGAEPLLVWGDLLQGSFLSWLGTTWSAATAAEPVHTVFDSMQREPRCFLESGCDPCAGRLLPWDITMGSGTPGALIHQFDGGSWMYCGGPHSMVNQSLWRAPLVSYPEGEEPLWDDMQEVWKDPLMKGREYSDELHFELLRWRVHNNGENSFIYADICGGDSNDCYHRESPRGRYSGLLAGSENDTQWSPMRGLVQGPQGEYIYRSYPLFEHSDLAVFPDGRVDIVYYNGHMVKFLASVDQGVSWQKLEESNAITVVEPSVPGWEHGRDIVWLRGVDRPGMAPGVLAIAKDTSSSAYRLALLTWRCDEQRWAATTDYDMPSARNRWDEEGFEPAVAVSPSGIVALAYGTDPVLGGNSINILRLASDGSTGYMDSAPVEDFPLEITLTWDGDEALQVAYTRTIENIPEYYPISYREYRSHLYMVRAEVRQDQ